MQIDLLAVGKRMPAWVETAVKEYSKRLSQNIKFNLIEVSPAIRSKNNNTDHFKQKEKENIEASLSTNSVIIVLDEKGKTIDSQFLATQLQLWIDNQQYISLIIGGADGLSEEIKKQADQIWSLSSMTLPHGLARVIITEQIYRAWTILQNHPYHRQ